MSAFSSSFSIDAARAWKQRREAMVAQMAQRLIDAGAINDRPAAFDCLIGHGYGRHADLLLDQAISAAQLAAVATAMQKPPMRPIAIIPLIDGSLSSPPSADGFTAAKIEIMAQDLVQAGALGCEQQAILTLSNRGHGHRDIGRLVARARARARELHAAAPKRISR
ncbi:hypothetical protein ACQR2B_06805 [Bradyrhizobium oligotrophicum]|uniref:hypothetical protein n=1 Tax=Bradyrhizobium TaxID=374 RepID=UPI003EBA6D08